MTRQFTGFSEQPYWLDDIEAPAKPSQEPLKKADVLIVGSGYTGLNAAIETARGGRSTLVLDAEAIGFGCSTRNGGQISTSVKPTLKKLTASLGAEKARAIRQEGANALEWIERRIENEKIDCDFVRSGRYHAAHTPQHYEMIAREAEQLRTEENIEAHAIAHSDQRTELGSDRYFGGVVFSRHASLHPAKYHQGLVEAALAAGATIKGHCRVLDIQRTSNGFEIATELGRVSAKSVIVATNGYTSNLTPWLKRRVIPIGSSIIATEPLPRNLVDQLFPKNRIASDTCKVLYYYRASPDRRRILFGGRVAAHEVGPQTATPRLYESMCRVFPELSDFGVTHSWGGTVAYSFDELAHIGIHDGVHYAMGYCGSGVSMASYLGMRIGQKVLALEEGKTAFDDLPHPSQLLYTGKPWFLPAAIGWYRWQDRRQAKAATSGPRIALKNQQ